MAAFCLDRLRAAFDKPRDVKRHATPSAFHRFVVEDDQAAGARPAVDKSHGHVWTPVTEESLAAAKDYWMQPELIFVDEPVFHQRPCQAGAPHDEDRLARPALELWNLSCNIPDDRCSLPIDPRECGRGDVLRLRVQGMCDQVVFVLDSRPVFFPDLVGFSSKQKGSCDLERLGVVAPVVWHQRLRPTPCRKPAVSILACVSGTLDHPVQRYVLDDDQL